MKKLISYKKIKRAIKRIAHEITVDYPADQPVVCIIVLNGAYMFASDLTKYMSRDCYIEFVKVSSYGDEITSSGKIDMVLEFKTRPEYKNAYFLIVEDIVDTGTTVAYLKTYLEKFDPKSISVASLLWKDKGNIEPDYYGFKIHKDEFVIGYGLDYKGEYRNLLNVYKVTNTNDL